MKTTALYFPSAESTVITTWAKPSFEWCEISAGVVVTARPRSGFVVHSEPFQQFKLKNESEVIDVQRMQKELFQSMVFFQRRCIELAHWLPVTKKAFVCNMFIEQACAVNVGDWTENTRQHMSMLKRQSGQVISIEKQASQTPKEKNMQKKLDAVDKMVNKYDMSMSQACKEAKISKATAKKWLNKQNDVVESSKKYKFFRR